MNSVVFGAVLVLCAATAEAQNATPAGVSQPQPQSPINSARVDSAIRPLRVHVVRGAEIGGISGLVAGALFVVAAATQTGQCNTTPSLDFGGCSEGLTRRKTAQIVTGGAIAGAFVGAILGYTYHTNLEEQREARCRSAPNGCRKRRPASNTENTSDTGTDRHAAVADGRARPANRGVGPGGTVFVPAGVPYTYTATDARYLIILTPRLDALIAELQSNRDKAAQSGVFAKYESTPLE